MITFEKTIKQAKILNPLKNFQEDTITFEYRTDPLTGRNTTVIKGMLNYINKFLTTDTELLKSLIEKTRANCPFCPENIKAKTPMFTKDFLPEGRIQIGNATVIPNLTGHAEKSILVILSKEHHLTLENFTPELILDGFRGGTAYLQKLTKAEPTVRYPVFTFNYMPPAGSSMLHPHMQILARDRPFYLTKLMLEKSKTYQETHRTNYWSDLIATEKHGQRYLTHINGAEWLTPFAPLRGMNEVQAIVSGKSNMLELTNDNWRGLAQGTSRILEFYHKQGYVSFNIVLLSGPLNEHLDYFDVNLRIISRPGMQALNFTDAWALPYMLWDGEAVEEPERLAERIRNEF
jgi:UDPglucose--hexose-1-phosphate uridylyltransferase